MREGLRATNGSRMKESSTPDTRNQVVNECEDWYWNRLRVDRDRGTEISVYHVPWRERSPVWSSWVPLEDTRTEGREFSDTREVPVNNTGLVKPEEIVHISTGGIQGTRNGRLSDLTCKKRTRTRSWTREISVRDVHL